MFMEALAWLSHQSPANVSTHQNRLAEHKHGTQRSNRGCCWQIVVLGSKGNPWVWFPRFNVWETLLSIITFETSLCRWRSSLAGSVPSLQFKSESARSRVPKVSKCLRASIYCSTSIRFSWLPAETVDEIYTKVMCSWFRKTLMREIARVSSPLSSVNCFFSFLIGFGVYFLPRPRPSFQILLPFRTWVWKALKVQLSEVGLS